MGKAGAKASKDVEKLPERSSSRKKKTTLETDKGGAPEEETKAAPTGNEVYDERKPIPKKDKDGKLRFDDAPDFRPNLTPFEVLQAGSFGGTYYRPIYSSVTKQKYKDVWKEFPDEWFEEMDIKKQVASPTYDIEVNRYKVKCGTDLVDWESKGWINAVDPYGWFQWYCRFYQGRRCEDDERQLGRAARCFGPTGRWRLRLMNLVGRGGKSWDDADVSPVIRQTLQHWGYTLTEKDYAAHAKKNNFELPHDDDDQKDDEGKEDEEVEEEEEEEEE